MTKLQWLVLLVAFALVVVLAFVLDTKPASHKSIEAKRTLSAVSTDITALMKEASLALNSNQASAIRTLELELESAGEESLEVEVYKKLSGQWYSLNKPEIAGYYAEKVAEILKNAEAWSISGTTYLICVQQEPEEKVKNFCAERAVQSLERAISLEPENTQHQINLALVYSEVPPKDSPMKGIQMLMELNKEFPENVPVMIQIGSLAMKTGQYDKAAERFEKALTLDPENFKAICLLAETYRFLGETAKAELFESRCEQVN